MLGKYFQDKSPEIFRPKITPDPEMQQRLAEKIKSLTSKSREFSAAQAADGQLNIRLSGSWQKGNIA